MPHEKRHSPQREAIRTALHAAPGPLSPAEVLDAARAIVPTLGIATVYRNLNYLVEQGEILAVDLGNQDTRYETVGRGHHHHFVCDDCGTAYDLPGCVGQIDGLLPDGFSMHDHEVLIFGTCAKCK